MTNEIATFASTNDLKLTLAGEYQKQITNFFGDDKKALKFLSSVVSSVQKTPQLLQCEQSSLINAFLTMAQLEFYPSEIAGEAYVLPYKNNKTGLSEAQFQIGYQGLVTLFYRAGAKKVHADIVREKDSFSYVNGKVQHSPDIFSDNRGKAIGAYVIITLSTWAEVAKVMSAKEILNIGSKFSKSFRSSFTPWNESKDPELWMWKKTVLKQCAKLVPKNEAIVKAIDEDNKDSIISDMPKPQESQRRLNEAMEKGKEMKMGSYEKKQDSPEYSKEESEYDSLPVINIEEEK